VPLTRSRIPTSVVRSWIEDRPHDATHYQPSMSLQRWRVFVASCSAGIYTNGAISIDSPTPTSTLNLKKHYHYGGIIICNETIYLYSKIVKINEPLSVIFLYKFSSSFIRKFRCVTKLQISKKKINKQKRYIPTVQ
jgi:hypothetical protein